MKNLPACTTCKNLKATLHCGICQESVCKSCVQFSDHESFAFMKEVPKDLEHGIYCIPCYNEKVVPELESYNQTMEEARNVIVYMKNQGKESRLIRSSQEPVRVEDCADREETLMRLAFYAAKANFNAIIGVDISSQKSGKTSYKVIKWSGTGIPAQVNSSQLKRRY